MRPTEYSNAPESYADVCILINKTWSSADLEIVVKLSDKVTRNILAWQKVLEDLLICRIEQLKVNAISTENAFFF